MMSEPERILIYHVGTLGDTLATVPAVAAVAQHYPNASRTLLFHEHVQERFVLPSDILRGAGLYDEFIAYRQHGRGSARWQLHTLIEVCRLLRRLRRGRFDTLVYLKPSLRGPGQCRRDRAFFRLAGIGRFIGMSHFYSFPERLAGQPVARVPHEADLLMARLAGDGIPIPAATQGRFDLGLGAEEYQAADEWARGQADNDARPWVGIGPGCKDPVNQWPEERYAELGRRLITRFNCWPVVFGGPGDEAMGQRLLESWGRGAVAAGHLGVRSGIAALQRCALFVGNDTGTIHMAAAAGVRCVGVYSGKSYFGLWYPYGAAHAVCKPALECANCLAGNCAETGNSCIRSIGVDEVFESCTRVLATTPAPAVDQRAFVTTV